ncbi:MAG: hypothetical protein Q4C64_06780 [Erysipelotrichia bacterium]|nr:hypothetical protein [Erysipelotrichia bacterium]
MLEITIPENEFYDNKTNTFIQKKEAKLKLEHSLLSISKWESKWCKPFYGDEKKSADEIRDYVRCMTLTQNIDSCVYSAIPMQELKKIEKYLEEKQTATVFYDTGRKNGASNNRKRKIVTSEEIYYMMICYEIPFSCEKWNINRLLALIEICSIRSDPKSNKMSKKDIFHNNATLNAARKAKLRRHG